MRAERRLVILLSLTKTAANLSSVPVQTLFEQEVNLLQLQSKLEVEFVAS